MAQNGRASGSLADKAAVPSPWALYKLIQEQPKYNKNMCLKKKIVYLLEWYVS